MSRESILVVDDDKDIRNLLKIYIENENYNFYQADSYLEALHILETTSIDIVILDVLLPDKNGFDCCLEIRKKTSIPIIFLSCKGEEMDKIIGLSVGADDYISKPFLPRELIARINANIRRSMSYSRAKSHDHIISLQNLSMNLITHEAHINNILIPLLPKEFDILLLLVKNPNRIFSKEEIYDYIWKDQVFDTDLNTIMVHISNIRKKMKLNNCDHPKIMTIKGIGYKLTLVK